MHLRTTRPSSRHAALRFAVVKRRGAVTKRRPGGRAGRCAYLLTRGAAELRDRLRRSVPTRVYFRPTRRWRTRRTPSRRTLLASSRRKGVADFDAAARVCAAFLREARAGTALAPLTRPTTVRSAAAASFLMRAGLAARARRAGTHMAEPPGGLRHADLQHAAQSSRWTRRCHRPAVDETLRDMAAAAGGARRGDGRLASPHFRWPNRAARSGQRRVRQAAREMRVAGAQADARHERATRSSRGAVTGAIPQIAHAHCSRAWAPLRRPPTVVSFNVRLRGGGARADAAEDGAARRTSACAGCRSGRCLPSRSRSIRVRARSPMARTEACVSSFKHGTRAPKRRKLNDELRCLDCRLPRAASRWTCRRSRARIRRGMGRRRHRWCRARTVRCREAPRRLLASPIDVMKMSSFSTLMALQDYCRLKATHHGQFSAGSSLSQQGARRPRPRSDLKGGMRPRAPSARTRIRRWTPPRTLTASVHALVALECSLGHDASTQAIERWPRSIRRSTRTTRYHRRERGSGRLLTWAGARQNWPARLIEKVRARGTTVRRADSAAARCPAAREERPAHSRRATPSPARRWNDEGRRRPARAQRAGRAGRDGRARRRTKSAAMPFLECPAALDGLDWATSVSTRYGSPTRTGTWPRHPQGAAGEYAEIPMVYWMREAELKHGRICMLAVVGWLTVDAFVTSTSRARSTRGLMLYTPTTCSRRATWASCCCSRRWVVRRPRGSGRAMVSPRAGLDTGARAARRAPSADSAPTSS